MKEPPFFTIGIPVYNSAQNIEKTLGSILMQEYEDFEIICVNDGSDDDSQKILSEMSKSDSRIIVFENDVNIGIALTRERICKLASGKFFLWCDSDDLMEKGCLLSLFNILKHHMTERIIVIQNARIFVNGKYSLLYKHKEGQLDPTSIRENMFTGNYWYSYPWTFCGNTELFACVEYPDNPRNYVDDQLISYRYFDNTDYCYFLDRINYTHIYYENTDSNNSTFYKRLADTYNINYDMAVDIDDDHRKIAKVMSCLSKAFYFSKEKNGNENKTMVKKLAAECREIKIRKKLLDAKNRIYYTFLTVFPSAFYFYYNRRGNG